MGPIHLEKSQKQRGSQARLQVSWLRKLAAHGEVEMCSSAAALLPHQFKADAPSAPTNRIQGSSLSDTHHGFGNKHRLYPLNSPIPNRTARRISPAIQLREKQFSDNSSEFSNCSTFFFFCQPKQSDLNWTGRTKPTSQWGKYQTIRLTKQHSSEHTISHGSPAPGLNFIVAFNYWKHCVMVMWTEASFQMFFRFQQ